MKKSQLFFISIYLLIFFCMKPERSHSQDIAGKWSGTMTMEITSRSEVGTYHCKVNLIIVNNQVTGSVESYGEGKTGTTTCSGSGKGELWRVAFSPEGTYDLQAISPVYTCINTSSIPGVPSDTSVAPNGLDLIANDNSIEGSRSVLVGSRTETYNMAGMGEQTTSVTWNLTGPVDAVLIITPNNYDNWLPEPGKNEFMKGSVMTISLKLSDGYGQPPKIKARSFELKLSNTTSEPGITINFPLVPGSPGLPDLRFIGRLDAESPGKAQTINISCRDGMTGEAYIGSYDGGGWTTLTVEAILENSTRIKGHLLVPGGIQEIPIPKSSPGSKIGLAWLNANGNPQDMDDIETSAGNTNDGDGLSAYEEYRGVWIEGEFRRLDPQKKELGVWGKRNDISLFFDGFKWFENASGIKILKFDENEIGTTKRLNKNVATAHIYDQFVLKLERNSLPDGEFGKTFDGHGIPSSINKIIIDIDQAARKYQNTVRYYNTLNIPIPYTFGEFVAKTIAHELGHGVNIDHHGPSGTPINLNATVSVPNPMLHVYLTTGEELTDPRYHLYGSAGRAQEQASGDISCLMNYLPGYDYSAKDINGVLHFYMVPDDLHIGSIFCTSQAGTGININPNYFGNAPNGKCQSRIKLK